MNLKFFFYRLTQFGEVKVLISRISSVELKLHTTISVKDKELAVIELKLLWIEVLFLDFDLLFPMICVIWNLSLQVGTEVQCTRIELFVVPQLKANELVNISKCLVNCFWFVCDLQLFFCFRLEANEIMKIINKLKRSINL